MDFREPYLQHAKHFLRVAMNTSDSLSRGGNALPGLLEFDAHWPNIENAWKWAHSRLPHDEDAARLCVEYLRYTGDVLALLRYRDALSTWSETALNCARMLADAEAEAIAHLYQGRALMSKGRGDEANVILQRSQAILKALGFERSATAGVILNLQGVLRCRQGLHAEAESLFQSAVSISEVTLGVEHPGTAARLNNLGMLHFHEGRSKEAEPILERARAIWEKALGFEHPDTGAIFNNLAIVHYQDGRYDQAEVLLQRAIAVFANLGPRYPKANVSLGNLGELYSKLGRYREAEPLLQSAIATCENVLGPDHADTAISLNNLAVLYCRQDRGAQAEPLLQRAIGILERTYGQDHPYSVRTLGNLALVHSRSASKVDAGLRIISIETSYGLRT